MRGYSGIRWEGRYIGIIDWQGGGGPFSYRIDDSVILEYECIPRYNKELCAVGFQWYVIRLRFSCWTIPRGFFFSKNINVIKVRSPGTVRLRLPVIGWTIWYYIYDAHRARIYIYELLGFACFSWVDYSTSVCLSLLDVLKQINLCHSLRTVCRWTICARRTPSCCTASIG